MGIIKILSVIAALSYSQMGFDRWKRDLNQPFQSDYVVVEPATA